MKLRLLSFALAAAAVMSACSSSSTETRTDGDLDMDMNVTVVEYMPAPGQFVNEGMTAATHAQAVAWAQSRLDSDNEYVSLGSFGGYVVVRTPEDVKNRTDKADFGIAGNAFDGSSEPGIVWVAEADMAGKPDVWYELRGSADTEVPAGVRRNCTVRYHKTAAPGDVSWEIEAYGESGVINHLPAHHAQNYFPAWAAEAATWSEADGGSYTLTGTMLPARTSQSSTTGEWYNANYIKGYVDNLGSDRKNHANGTYAYNRFDINDAIDAEGNSVDLEKIRFIKVQSAILQNAGILGEVSTEVFGFKIF